MSVELTSVSKKPDGDIDTKDVEKGIENKGFDNGDIDKTANGSGTSNTPPSAPPLESNNVILTVVEEGPEEEEDVMNDCSRAVLYIQTIVYAFINDNWKDIVYVIQIVLLTGYFVYFGFAMAKSFEVDSEPPMRLLVCTIIGILILMTKIFFKIYGYKVDEIWDRTMKKYLKSRGCTRCTRWAKLSLKVVVFFAIAIFVLVDIAEDNPQSLMSLAGLAIYIFLFYITSFNPAKVNWHPVFWGIATQYILALIILRWEFGYRMFEYLGNRTQEFLAYSDQGAEFMFGPDFRDHFFGFAVLPLIIFFYSMISILYYLGVMQFIVRNIGQALAFMLGTSPAESLNAAGNIFVGMTESPVMIQPFLEKMTKSELHAVMVGGFATIAGSVYGAYVKFGVPANHLLSASVMSAPAALAMAKLSYPEVERTKSTSKDFYKMGKSPHRNIIEAASAGAASSVKVVAGIAVHVIAFLSILKFVDATLTWFGELVEVEGLTLEFICSYVFFPIPFFMGTSIRDCRSVARLIGLKTFTNEFVAYDQLGGIIKNKKIFSDYVMGNHTDWHYKGDDLWLPSFDGGLKILKNGILEMARGRVFQCVHCKPVKVTAGEKSNMENHILRMHVSNFNVPYLCRLCGYKCIKAREFAWHTTHLKDHIEKRKASGDKCDESRYMIVAATPYVITEGKDLERWDKARSEEFWKAKDEKKLKAKTPPSLPSKTDEITQATPLELASPRKLGTLERNLLDEILTDEPFVLEPTEEAALPEPPALMSNEMVRSPSPSSSSSSSSSSSASKPDIELKETLEDFCDKMVSAINGLTKAVESQNLILKQLAEKLENPKRERSRSPSYRRFPDKRWKRY